jgi:hypothetical protein
MTVQEQIQADIPQQPVGILDPTQLPRNASALTSTGRTFTKAAQQLQTLQARRKQVLAQYEEQQKQLAPIIEELWRIHAMIDTVVNEMSAS